MKYDMTYLSNRGKDINFCIMQDHFIYAC